MTVVVMWLPIIYSEKRTFGFMHDERKMKITESLLLINLRFFTQDLRRSIPTDAVSAKAPEIMTSRSVTVKYNCTISVVLILGENKKTIIERKRKTNTRSRGESLSLDKLGIIVEILKNIMFVQLLSIMFSMPVVNSSRLFAYLYEQ